MPNEQVKPTASDCSTNTTQDATYSEFDDRSLRWTQKMLTMVGTDLLPIVKEDSSQYRCICPVCGEDNLKISKSGGGYTCFRNYCERADIREALIPARSEFRHEGNRIRISQQAKEDIIPAKLPSKPLEFAIADSKDKPEPRESKYGFKKKRNDGDGEFECDTVIYTEYKYESATIDGIGRSREVQRTEYFLEGKRVGTKTLRPRHQTYLTEGWVLGKDRVKVGEANPGEKQKDKPTIWVPYRIEEVRANAKGKILFGVEGEKTVESLRSLGLAATTQQGSDWGVEGLKRGISELKQVEVGLLFYIADNDKAGEKKRQDIAIAAAKEGLPCIGISITALYPDAPQKYDIADYIEDQLNLGGTHMEIKTEIEEKVQAIAAEEVQKQAEASEESATRKHIVSELNINRLEAIECLNYLKQDFYNQDENWFEVGRCFYFLANRQELDSETSERWNTELLEKWEKWSRKANDDRAEVCTSVWWAMKNQEAASLDWLFEKASERGWDRDTSAKKREREENRKRRTAQIRAEVAELLEIKDIAEQALAKSDLMSRNHLDPKTLDILIQEEIERKYNGGVIFDSRPQVMSLDECFKQEIPQAVPIVEGWFAEGMDVLFSALPGGGKTKLACELAYAIATGGQFLGAQAQQGTVLFVSSDQPQKITEQYFYSIGAYENQDARHNIKIIGDRGGKKMWTTKEADYLQEVVNKIKPSVVIIDSLRGVVAGTGIDENSAQIGAPIAMVNSICHKQNATVVWIHHSNKDAKAVGISRASGSTDIPARVSTHLHIEKKYPDTDKPDRVISVVKCRYVGEHTAEAVMLPSGRFELTSANGKNAEELGGESKKRQLVLEALLKCPNGSELEPLSYELGFDPLKTLCELVRQGCVEKFKSRNKGKNNKALTVYALSKTKRTQLENTPSYSGASRNLSDAVIEKYTNAGEKDEEFDFESSPHNPENGLNPDDLQPATPKGSDRTQEQAVAGVSEAVEEEASEVEEPPVESAVKESQPAQYSADHEPERVVACEALRLVADRMLAEEADTVTVDGMTYKIGEVVNHTDHDLAVKVKVLGKGWIVNPGNLQLEGVTVEYLEGRIDPIAHIEGGEWIISAGQVRTTYTKFLSKITIADCISDSLSESSEQQQPIIVKGINYLPGGVVFYKPTTNESAEVELLMESESGDITVRCLRTTGNQCPFKAGDIITVERETLNHHPYWW